MSLFVRKENMKSLIITSNREFGLRSVQMLNAAAFPAEKFTTAEISDARAQLLKDKSIRNIIIDGCDGAGRKLIENKADFLKFLETRDDLVTLVYVADPSQVDIFSKFYPDLTTMNLRALPQDKTHFIEVLHSKGPKKKEAAPPPAAKEPPKTSQTLIEAASHVKDTIAKINELSSDLTQVPKLLEVGQKFNAFVGTFPYLEAKDGIRQLRQLSEIIDNLARTYTNDPNRKQVEKHHFDLLFNAAKCYYTTLKKLADGSPMDYKIMDEIGAVLFNFGLATDIYRRQVHSQDEIDALLDAHLNAG